MPFVTANTLQLYYEIHGQGPQTLLLLAGLTRDSRVWQWILPELSKHFRVVCIDNRCAGQSDQPDEPFMIADMAGRRVSVFASSGYPKNACAWAFDGWFYGTAIGSSPSRSH